MTGRRPWSAGRSSPTCIWRNASLTLPAAGLLAALVSCATLPSSRPAEALWGLLPADSELFLFTDLQAARGLVEPLAGRLISGEPEQLKKLLERTDALYAGLKFQPGAPLLAEAAVLGGARASPLSGGTAGCRWR
jgi:hypothetical protein